MDEGGIQITSAEPRRLDRTKSGACFDGVFPGAKAIGPVIFESLLERDFFTLLEADPCVASYEVGAHVLEYWAPNRRGVLTKRSYRPDCKVTRHRGGAFFVDVKAKFFTTQQSWVDLEPYKREAFARLGFPFLVVTEEEVRAEPRLANCKQVYAYGSKGVDPAAKLAVEGIVDAPNGADELCKVLGAARKQGFSTDEAWGGLCSLILDGAVSMDLSRPIKWWTPVRRGAE